MNKNSQVFQEKKKGNLCLQILELDMYTYMIYFPSGSNSKESAHNVGYPGLIPESGRSPGEGNGYPPHGYSLWYSCLENSMDRGTWRLQPMESQSQTRLSD